MNKPAGRGFSVTNWRNLSLVGLLLTIALVFVFIPAIPQDPGYHLFADIRTCFGVSNFGNAASNMAFLFVGGFGLWLCTGGRGARLFAIKSDALPYVVFFAGILLVSAGSFYYHLAPDNDRLYWDRLPMTVAFMAIVAAILADRMTGAAQAKWLLPLLIAVGFASVTYWAWSEAQGHGDLRFYGMVQFLPLAIVPVLILACPNYRNLPTRTLIWVIAWYVLAKLLEFFDWQIYELFGNLISGHSLKHLAAAVAPFVIVRALYEKGQRSNER